MSSRARNSTKNGVMAPEVDDVGADADEVVHDPRELGQDHADGLGPRRRRDAQQLLHRQRPAVPVHERRAVVQAVGVRDDLPVGPVLRHLLEVPVHVADLGLGSPRSSRRPSPPARGRCRAWPGCEGPMFTTGCSVSAGTSSSHSFGDFRTWRCAGGVVLAHRVADEGVVGEDARQVRVAVEDDAVEVPGLALEPVGALVDAGERVDGGVRLGQRASSGGRGASCETEYSVQHDLVAVVALASS